MGNAAFDNTLKELRLMAKKTVLEVSEYLTSLGYKASEKTVYSWESGRSRPTIDIFLDMCKFYGVTDVLSYFGDSPNKEKRGLSREEEEHIKKYRILGRHGKEVVDSVLNLEYKHTIEARKKDEDHQDEKTIVYFPVPEYIEPVSAGTGETIGIPYPENINLIKEPPRGTSFIAHVRGDSMEPTFQDGDMIFVHAQNEIQKGQIGVFFMGGMEYIKELGDDELISHNPKYDPIEFEEDIRCQGLVLGVCDDSYLDEDE